MINSNCVLLIDRYGDSIRLWQVGYFAATVSGWHGAPGLHYDVVPSVVEG